jgi:hypothetical protein
MKNCNCLADQFGQTDLNTSGQNYSPVALPINTDFDFSEKTKKKPVKKWVNQPITKADIQEAEDMYNAGKGVGTIKIGNPQLVTTPIQPNQALTLPGQQPALMARSGLKDAITDTISKVKDILKPSEKTVEPGTNPVGGVLPGTQAVTPAKSFLSKYGLIVAAGAVAIYLYAKK